MGHVTIVSAAPDLRATVSAALQQLGFGIVATCATVADLPTDASHASEIVVLGLERVRSEDATLVKAMRERLPEAQLLIVLRRGKNPDRRAPTVGADGVLYECELDATLGPAVTALLSGLAVFPRDLNPGRANPNFSSREKQVLAMVVMGFSNVEIASKLYLAESTVKSHLSSAFRKLGVGSRKDAAARILDPESGLGAGILAISDGGLAMLSAGRQKAAAA